MLLIRLPLPLMQGAFDKNDLANCKTLLSQLKVSCTAFSKTPSEVLGTFRAWPTRPSLPSHLLQLELTKLPALPPVFEQTATSQQQLQLARERGGPH